MTFEGRPAFSASDNARGALFMCLSMAGFAFNDALIKSVSGDLPLFQAIAVRGLLATTLIGIYAWRVGALRFRPGARDARLIALRAVGEIGGGLTFLTALFNMPIANASAILQSLPLAVTLAAAVFFGEPVGWRRYLAIAVGFAGVLIIVRPGSDGFTVYSLWALASVGFVVVRDLATRRLSAAAPGPAIVFITSFAMTLTAGTLTAATEWRPMELHSLASLGGSALFLLVGYHYSVNSMRTGEIGFVQPFRYTLLIWATVLGILMFGEWPDFWTLVGGGIVVATGLFTFYRERRVARAYNG